MCNLFVYFSTRQIQWVSIETLNLNIMCLSPPAGVFKAICMWYVYAYSYLSLPLQEDLIP